MIAGFGLGGVDQETLRLQSVTRRAGGGIRGCPKESADRGPAGQVRTACNAVEHH